MKKIIITSDKIVNKGDKTNEDIQYVINLLIKNNCVLVEKETTLENKENWILKYNKK